VRILRIARYASLTGAYDYAAIYSWKTWLTGWYLRVFCQVVFFALIGKLLDSEAETRFLLVGNAVMLAAMQGVWSMNLLMWDRSTGVLPLLVASPSSAVIALAARGSYLIVDGVLSALAALAVAGPIFGLPLPWPRVLLVVPLTVLVGASSYAFGTFLGGLIMRARWLSNLVSNVSVVALMALCGVNVPLEAYPEVVRSAAQLLPLTHGLLAIRAVFDGDLATTARQAGLEVAVGAGWLVLCLWTFDWFLGAGRRDGSIEYAS
jgi:ABC-2 type transport system permease protein